MKKSLLLIAAVAAVVCLLSSCRPCRPACPAYADVVKTITVDKVHF
ncbi:MAG: hypothetical protein IIU11_07480 [Bacteroidales bacterium]|nr:hypothetical protein [Bacteroidales bacterium]